MEWVYCGIVTDQLRKQKSIQSIAIQNDSIPAGDIGLPIFTTNWMNSKKYSKFWTKGGRLLHSCVIREVFHSIRFPNLYRLWLVRPHS